MWRPESNLQTDDDWVRTAASLPVAFAQVREDPWIDVELVNRLNRPARVLMVASGGDTACLLATMPLRQIHLVDVNPAQLDLTRFKLHLLKTATTDERLQLLGHEPMAADTRAHELARRFTELGLPADALGPPDRVAEYGPDFCGRYEWLFARLRDLLSHERDEIRELLLLSDPAEQKRRVRNGTALASRLETAFLEVMDLSRLVKIFGREATSNRVQPFAQHFLDQTLNALATFPAAENPFLHQIFLGSFPRYFWPWHSAVPASSPAQIKFTLGGMDSVLAELSAGSYDLVHLSNILDWIAPDEAQRVLQNARRCLSPGGLVVIRQLNSVLDIGALHSGFEWLDALSERLHQADRSFFYRRLVVGMRS